MKDKKRKILVLSLLLVMVFTLTFVKKDQAPVSAEKKETPIVMSSPIIEKTEQTGDVKELIYKVQQLDENVSKLREDLNNQEKIKLLVDK